MLGQVAKAYQQFDDARPFVRPTYNQLEVTILPPYGDPEVHILGEVGTYFVAGVLANAVVERLVEE
ncbi:hypothetical protein [Halorubrum sp. DTA98]|uniref:hypothetical protein n=1 Tax=Halorubrum sp. DTA98 TaxID=3402163 RepID=UPI003AABE278